MADAQGNAGISQLYAKTIRKLTQWKFAFASWQFGSQDDKHGPTRAVKNHYEITLSLRAEVNALAQLCIAKGVFTDAEFLAAVIEEATKLDAAYEAMFPGVKTTETGVTINPSLFAETCKRLGFPR